MEVLKRRSGVCPVDQHCSEWANKHMGYCLCSRRDWFSLSLGLISVVSWSVAEIPQIITNYRKKSAEGLSIVFLSTWIVGDFFNLFGCMLEPATLPTQYYTAVLYTVTTIILGTQSVYYGHIYPRLKTNKRRQEAVERRREQIGDVDTEKANNEERWRFAPSSPIPVAFSPNSSEDLYFISARSLSVSHTPTAGSLLAPRTPTGSFLAPKTPTGSFLAPRTPPDVERNWLKEPFLSEARSTQSAPPKIKTMMCVVSLMTFFIGSYNHQIAESSTKNGMAKGGIVLRVGRRLLEVAGASRQETLAAESSGIGSFLGWGMATIYLGGRLPQIWLNIRRGNAEGLSPLMFLFAVVGNATYVASILVSSIDWLKIQPNLPWLVDAGGCVLLDIFILIQFVYFRYRSRNEMEKYLC